MDIYDIYLRKASCGGRASSATTSWLLLQQDLVDLKLFAWGTRPAQPGLFTLRCRPSIEGGVEYHMFSAGQIRVQEAGYSKSPNFERQR